MRPAYHLVYFLVLSLVASGCTGFINKADSLPPIEWDAKAIELTTTPFFPQTQYQCGPASLATVLKASGLNIDAATLVGEVYIPDRKGALQVEMIAAVRRHGRTPYQIDNDLQSIIDQLRHGLPVLVLLTLGYSALPVYHYAVVIGYEPDSDSLIMRSGEDYRLLMSRHQFLSAWSKSGNWALAVPSPGKLPANVNVERYLGAVIALESVGQWHAAQQSYLSVLSKWPENTLARFGLANSLRSQGKLTEAVDQYRQVLKQDTDHRPARNNLADTLLRLGRCDDALSVLEPALINNASEADTDKAANMTRIEIQEACPDTPAMQ